MAVKEDFNIKKVNEDYTKFHVLEVWPEGESRPSLAILVNKDSRLLLHLLDLLEDPDNVEWLNQDVKLWRGPGHGRFVQFVRNLDVVNDCSER